jgi:hypothetical protein
VLEAVEGRDEPCAMLLQEDSAFFVEHDAVFDGVDAGANGGFHSGSVFDVAMIFCRRGGRFQISTVGARCEVDHDATRTSHSKLLRILIREE